MHLVIIVVVKGIQESLDLLLQQLLFAFRQVYLLSANSMIQCRALVTMILIIILPDF